MQQIELDELQIQLSRLIEQALRGEEVVMTRSQPCSNSGRRSW
jgi:antitoxin (DNA-binding transcriptional repressor) of toxin-antitoxin stability system